VIGFSLEHIDFLQRQVAAIEEEIEAGVAPYREAGGAALHHSGRQGERSH
jgi:hypothetical protein